MPPFLSVLGEVRSDIWFSQGGGPAAMPNASHPTVEKPTVQHKGHQLHRKWLKQEVGGQWKPSEL